MRYHHTRPIQTAGTSPDADDTIDWRQRSACSDATVLFPASVDLFFPANGAGLNVLLAKEAKAVCSRCPVKEQCLQWALDTNERHGIWGGKTDDERRSLKRRAAARRAARHRATTAA